MPLTALVLILLGTLLSTSAKPSTKGKFTVVDNVDVETVYGWIRGQRLQDAGGRMYDEFLGVPYAAAPVGALRWQRPLELEDWEGVRDATRYSMHCTSFIAPLYFLLGVGGQHGEDCLYLNIHVPHTTAKKREGGLPVMVYLFGGGYALGTGAMYHGQDLALKGDVIVITINYRVSTLGWLSSGDDVLKGNYGLWDAHAALRWVQANIERFGGDRTRVTLFGQSAGAAMTSHALISPQFDGLVHRGIAFSGAASSGFGLSSNSRNAILRMSEAFDCNTEDSQEIVDCLMQEDSHDLDFWGMMAGAVGAPVMDGEIVLRDPSDAYAQGFGSAKDYMVGLTEHDSAGMLIMNPIALPILGDRLNAAATLESTRALVRGRFNFAENTDELVDMAYERYPDLANPDNETRTIAASYFQTDSSFGSPTHYEAVEHSKNSANTNGGSTYLYNYHFRHSFLIGYPDWIEGSHLDDLYTVLGDSFFGLYRRLILGDWEERDYKASTEWMSYLSNFAHTGDPNSGPNEVPVQWPNYAEAMDERFVLSDDPYVQKVPDDRASLWHFWKHELPDYIVMPDKTEETKPKISGKDLEAKALEFKRQIRKLANGNDNEWLKSALSKAEGIIDGFIHRRRAKIAAKHIKHREA